MSKRVLLTGVGGFVGHHCLEYFLEKTDWDLVCLDSFRHKGTYQRVIDVYKESPRVKVYRHDLTVPIDPQLENMLLGKKYVNDQIEEDKLHYIINIASNSAVERSTTDPTECCRNNHDLMCNMLEFARKLQGLENFVHISTDEVYGEAGPDGSHKEWSTIMPSNPYAASKASQEALAIAYWRTYNMPISIVNIMNMIGERQDPEKFLPKIIQKVVSGNRMPIYCDKKDGKVHIGSRVYLHAKNMADALIHILDKSPTLYSHFDKTYEARPDKWNVCGDTEMDNLELAQLVAKIMGRELNYELVESESARPGYDRRYALDGSKLAATGWVAPMTFEESIKSIVDWTLANPQWTV